MTALVRRDQALAELDRGDAEQARVIASDALVLLEMSGQGESIDAAALLVALAEIHESLGHFGQARSAAGRAAAMLAADVDPDDPEDRDTFWLWCQAHERLAGLDRIRGGFGKAAARLADLIERAARILGPVSEAVVSAENGLGMAYKYAGRFDEAPSTTRPGVSMRPGLSTGKRC